MTNVTELQSLPGLGLGLSDLTPRLGVHSSHGDRDRPHRNISVSPGPIFQHLPDSSGSSASQIKNDSEWAAVYERLKKHDEAMITGHSGDIDSLLILAGLFSAVLTSFLVQVYTQLQPANTPMSTAIALDLSRSIVERLSLPSTSEIFAATSIPAVSPSMVAINALWFMSLVLSLGSALLGISAKQWLRQYILWTNVTPPSHAVPLRQYRYTQFERWKVQTIVSSLPGILQLSVFFFFIGLVILLWPLNTTVAVVVTAAVALTFACAIVAIALPVVIDTCPYKTPTGWLLIDVKDFIQKRFIHPVLGLAARTSIQVIFWSLTAVSRIPSYREHRRRIWNDWINKLLDAPSHPTREYHGSWAHRDLAIHVAGRTQLRSTFWKSWALLWVSAQDELDTEQIKGCAKSLPDTLISLWSPRMLTEDDLTLSKTDDPYERLCGCWLAICTILYIPRSRSIPFCDQLQDIYTQRKNTLQILEALKVIVPHKLRTLRPAQRRGMYHLLSSFLHGKRVSPPQRYPEPFTEDNVNYLYLSSFYVMLILCTLQIDLRPLFLNTLLRLLCQPGILHSPNGNPTRTLIDLVFYIFHEVAASTVGRFRLGGGGQSWRETLETCPEDEICEIISSVIELGDQAATGTATSTELLPVYWSAVKFICSLDATSSLATHLRTPSQPRRKALTHAFLENIYDVLASDLHRFGSGPSPACMDVSNLWITLLSFLGRHSDTNVAAAKLVRCLLACQERGLAQFDVVGDFRYYYNGSGPAAWTLEELYAHFGYTPGSYQAPQEPILPL